MVVLGSAGARPAARPLVCILDVRLMLEPLGLELAFRLARQVETWLVRRLWTMLDNDSFYQRWPDELARDCTSEHAAQLARWRTAWLEGQLNQRFFWVGDARYESVLPMDVDVTVRDRLDRLSAELDPEGEETSEPRLQVLDQCGRDALALAAALHNDNPVILTAAGRSLEPGLISFAQRAGVFEIAPATRRDVDLVPAAMRYIVAPLSTFGLSVAAVHVIAPAAAAMEPRPPTADEWESRADVARGYWSDARLVWQPFAGGSA